MGRRCVLYNKPFPIEVSDRVASVSFLGESRLRRSSILGLSGSADNVGLARRQGLLSCFHAAVRRARRGNGGRVSAAALSRASQGPCDGQLELVGIRRGRRGGPKGLWRAGTPGRRAVPRFRSAVPPWAALESLPLRLSLSHVVAGHSRPAECRCGRAHGERGERGAW